MNDLLVIGEKFSINPHDHNLGCLGRRLIFYKNRPIGHWSDGHYDGGGYLWLQRNKGYYHPSQFIHFQNLELAINYAWNQVIKPITN